MAKKIVYLTIDDSPSKDFRKKVDFLLAKEIPVIFFCSGSFLEKGEEDVVYAIKKRFIIANHSYDHSRFSEITLEEAFEQIKKTDKIIEKLYSKSRINRPAKLFRFPYGNKGGKNYAEIQKFLKRLGYKQPLFKNIKYDWFNNSNLKTDADVFWTFDIMEWHLKSIKNIFNRMEQKEHKQEGNLLNSNSNEIILMHDHEETKEYFYKIIDKLLDMNIKFELPKF